MKAITIHQPYAHLIVHADNELPDGAHHKRVENRRWEAPKSIRGDDILIHAGKSLDWLDKGDWPIGHLPGCKSKFDDFPEFAFGALVGIARLTAVINLSNLKDRDGDSVFRDWFQRWSWLLDHKHACGPYCWVLENIRRFKQPIPYKGAQGLFDVSDDVWMGTSLIPVHEKGTPCNPSK